MKHSFDVDFSIEEDELLKKLVSAEGKRVEVVAFGIIYSGILASVDVDLGNVVVQDGEDQAVIEIERVESLSVLEG
jgi:allophanate hydrolase subunit 2